MTENLFYFVVCGVTTTGERYETETWSGAAPSTLADARKIAASQLVRNTSASFVRIMLASATGDTGYRMETVWPTV